MTWDGYHYTNVRIDKEIWKKFRLFVFLKYGSYKGHLGSEIENALIEYMKENGMDHGNQR